MSDYAELLILEVESRPGLYRSDLPEYKDRNLKLKLWGEVCANIIPRWDELDSKEKTEKGKEIQKRWKSVRDCFRRDLALQKKTPSGSGAIKNRRYMHFDQLQFLLPTMEQRSTTTSLVQSDEQETQNSIEPEQTVDPHGPEQAVEPHGSEKLPEPRNSKTQSEAQSKAGKRQTNSFENDLIRILEQKATKTEDFDEDKHFLLSLLPAMKKFNDDNKLLVRVEILNVIRRIQSYSGTQQHQFQVPHHSWEPQRNSWDPPTTAPFPIPSPTISETSFDGSNCSDLLDIGEIY